MVNGLGRSASGLIGSLFVQLRVTPVCDTKVQRRQEVL